MSDAIHRGMSMRDAQREATRLGIHNEWARSTGEIAFRRPDGRLLLVNGRKKDAPTVLVSLLRQVEKARRAGVV